MGTGAIIALILSSLLAFAGGIATYSATNKTNQVNQDQYEDWKEYNTPANQMQRLDDAGLNPYLVSNVGNTLSQPFQIGVNNGIAEALNGLSNSVATGANFAQSHYENELNREIQKQNLQIKDRSNELTMLGLQIKQKLANNAWRIGDARSALYWSQVRGQDILNLYNRSALPYRLQGLYLGNSLRQQELEHNAEMFPQIEALYEPAQRAKINSAYRQMSHYDFMESFMKEKFMQEMSLAWDKHFFNQDYSWRRFYQAENFFNQRLGLSRDYFGLAKRKFRWNNALNWYKAFQTDRKQAFDFLDNFIPN